MPAPVRPGVLVGARLLDGRSSDPIARGIVATDDRGRIAAAGPAETTAVPSDAERIDLAGLTVLPGIVDCHVHLTLRLEPVADQVQRSATDLVVRGLQTGRDFLEAGVTTVRDAGYAPAGIKRAFATGSFPGPRTQVSCTPLSQTGGHGDMWTPSGAVLDDGGERSAARDRRRRGRRASAPPGCRSGPAPIGSRSWRRAAFSRRRTRRTPASSRSMRYAPSSRRPARPVSKARSPTPRERPASRTHCAPASPASSTAT